MVILLLLSLTFTASVDNTVVPAGESFNVSVAVEGENLSGIDAPSAPEVSGIDILGSSRSQSTQINFINGKLDKTTSITHDYQMIARKEGTFTIPPFTLEHKGKKYSTDPIKITVKKGISRPSTPSPINNYDNIRTKSRAFRPVFLESEVSKSSVYPGEPLIVTHYIYTKTSLGDIQLVGPTDYENVWVENVKSPTRLDFERTTKNGISYERALVKQDVLFPLGEKNVKINTFSLMVVVRGDMFSFFGERKTISSEERTINVKPFPLERPPEFIDAVGNFSINAEVDTSNLKVDAPFTVKIIIKGQGNLNLLSAPKFPESRKLTSYDPESNVKTRISGSTLAGERTFSYLVTPKVSGVIEIPEIKWAYFDISSKKFISKKLGSWRIKVRPGSEIGGEEKSANQINRDIAYILPLEGRRVSLIPGFFPLYFLPGVIFLILSLYYVIDTRKMLGDMRYANMKAIPKELKKGFKKLEKEIEDNDSPQFYEHLTRLLLKFLKLKFHMDPFGMKKAEIISELKDKKIQEKTLLLLKELLERSETVRFTSLKLEKKDMVKDLKTAKEVINALY
jgi:hypothetical protein